MLFARVGLWLVFGFWIFGFPCVCWFVKLINLMFWVRFMVCGLLCCVEVACVA